MSIVVTGASGQLGRLAVEALLRRGVAADQVIATGRRTEALADFAERGVVVRRADYDDRASLDEAFRGAERLLLVSGSDVGSRVPQHEAAIAAAAGAGVSFIAYTSILHAPTSTVSLAVEHRATEATLAASGVTHALLRNGWYVENYTAQVPTYLEHGIAGASGDGRISAATRGDYADAAAAVVSGDISTDATYELGGPAFTMTEFADALSAATGRSIAYTNLSVPAYAQVLLGAGLPQPVAEMFADIDSAIEQGELYVDTHDLETLLGRPATPLAEALATTAAEAPAS